MKGVVFTEFVEFVEDEFGLDIADDMIDNSELESGGAYTSVGTYDHREMVELVTQLHLLTDKPVDGLIHAYGKHLFGRFAAGYEQFFKGVDSAFDFLQSIEHYIHVEVRKLYPDAELPSFDYSRPAENQLEMIYRSQRAFGDLAAGLIDGCIEFFNEDIKIERESLPADSGTCIRFLLTKQY
ncbi:MAG: heme NO-binding domain-containing protein [Calditrichia bacterium]